VIVSSNRIPGVFIGAAFMFAFAVPFLAVYLNGRSRWWALIPAFVRASVGVLILLGIYSTSGRVLSYRSPLVYRSFTYISSSRSSIGAPSPRPAS
jgi:hypothetical protein